MRHFPARFEGVSLSPFGEPAARLSCDAKYIPLPGQAFLSHHAQDNNPLRKLIFPAQSTIGGFITDTAPDPSWNFGDPLDLWGPLGNGFTPQPNTSRWLLMSIKQPPIRLMSLIDIGLERGVSITLHTDDRIPNVPPQVEVNPDLREAILWADFLAIDLPLEELPNLNSILGINDVSIIPLNSQILISSFLPCGIGACGTCAVKGRRSWKLTCTEGPVFNLSDLEW